MTISVNLYSEEQEKALLAFLDGQHLEYQVDSDLALSDAQLQEILLRDKELAEGKVTARNWNDIQQELKRVYR